MTKATVTRLFIGSLIAFGAGAIVAIMAIGVAMANDVFVMDGDDIAGIQGGTLAWALIWLIVVGALAAAGGVIAGFVAWIGAVLNTGSSTARRGSSGCCCWGSSTSASSR
jgi:hypothetical protein